MCKVNKNLHIFLCKNNMMFAIHAKKKQFM